MVEPEGLQVVFVMIAKIAAMVIAFLTTLVAAILVGEFLVAYAKTFITRGVPREDSQAPPA
jgi:hypothetical protein